MWHRLSKWKRTSASAKQQRSWGGRRLDVSVDTNMDASELGGQILGDRCVAGGVVELSMTGDMVDRNLGGSMVEDTEEEDDLVCRE